MAHGGRARGEMGCREQCGSNKSALVHFRLNLTTGLIWLVTRVGGWRAGKGGDGEGAPGRGVGAVGRWPMEGRQVGEMGGGTREQCGSNKSWVPLRTGQLIWSDLDEGRRWRGRWARGEMGGGGHQRAVWEQQGCIGSSLGSGGGARERATKGCTGSFFWAPLKT